MRPLSAFLVSTIIICACTQSKKEGLATAEPVAESAGKVGSTLSGFEKLVANLKLLEIGYTYDLVNQDTEGSYSPEGSDTLYYNPPFAILGVLKDNANIFSIIHFEPGDDLYPVLRTFDRSGKQIDQKVIIYGNCAGWDCDFDECSEVFKITDRNTIEDVLTLVLTPCDSLGNKQPHLTKKTIDRKIIRIGDQGEITVEQKTE